MNDNTKIEVAREVMNAMLGRYGQGGYDKSNETLMILLDDEKEMNKNFGHAYNYIKSLRRKLNARRVC